MMKKKKKVEMEMDRTVAGMANERRSPPKINGGNLRKCEKNG